jgi:replicative DNA helicase
MNEAIITTKVVKIPVRVMEDDNELRILKYKALNEMMKEARYLGNMAIRYAIAYRLKGIPKEIDVKKEALSVLLYKKTGITSSNI